MQYSRYNVPIWHKEVVKIIFKWFSGFPWLSGHASLVGHSWWNYWKEVFCHFEIAQLVKFKSRAAGSCPCHFWGEASWASSQHQGGKRKEERKDRGGGQRGKEKGRRDLRDRIQPRPWIQPFLNFLIMKAKKISFSFKINWGSFLSFAWRCPDRYNMEFFNSISSLLEVRKVEVRACTCFGSGCVRYVICQVI